MAWRLREDQIQKASPVIIYSRQFDRLLARLGREMYESAPLLFR